MSGFTRHVKDPVHDYIEIGILAQFIDTRTFQRLRAIKQLGTSYYVWPGAQHNRFEHCLGVAHLARLQAEHLRTSQPELQISTRDVECVELAGLCHDLGHGPWSHVWDGIFYPVAKPDGPAWTHEQGSEMMFDYLVKCKGIDLPAKDSEFIKALISGESSRCPDEKPFLFEIVANKRNGIDVDKFDYIARDSHAIGEKGNLSLTRLIQSARVIENQICYEIKDANQLYELCYTRFSLHKRIYNHKTAKAIEYMIIDALLLAEPFLHLADQCLQPDRYVHLTDDIMPTIERTELVSSPLHKELAPARLIFDRIRERNLYKCVDFKVFSWEYKNVLRKYFTPEKIVEAARLIPIEDLPEAATPTEEQSQQSEDEMDDIEGDDLSVSGNLNPQHVIVDLAPMHYGMKDKNPLDSIKFYSMKNNPDKCYSASPGDVSTLMPATFGEVMLRIYTRDPRYFGIIQAGYRALLVNLPDSRSATPMASTQPLISSQTCTTPSITPPPTTPRKMSSRPLNGASSFSNNEFTTVSPSFGVPPSPLQGENMKPKSRVEKPKSWVGKSKVGEKRAREDDATGHGDSPVKKKAAY